MYDAYADQVLDNQLRLCDNLETGPNCSPTWTTVGAFFKISKNHPQTRGYFAIALKIRSLLLSLALGTNDIFRKKNKQCPGEVILDSSTT